MDGIDKRSSAEARGVPDLNQELEDLGPSFDPAALPGMPFQESAEMQSDNAHLCLRIEGTEYEGWKESCNQLGPEVSMNRSDHVLLEGRERKVLPTEDLR